MRSTRVGLEDKKLRFVVGALTILAASAIIWGGPVPVDAQETNRVGLVIDFGTHHITRCVEFAEPELTGYDVLRRAGLNLVVDPSNPMGVIVCDINDTSGCPPTDCFCQCQGSPCVYWSYHYLQGGAWQYAQQGASDRKVRDGDVEGWGWGEGKLNTSGSEPPVVPFEQICAPPATDTPQPTSTPVPPTNTPVPSTNTPAPSATPESTSPPALEVWFRLDENPISAGSCTMLRWDTANAQEVYLDEDSVDVIGSREVCPTEPTDYELRVVGLEEEEIFQLTLGVTGSTPTAAETPPTTTEALRPSPTATPDTPSTPTESPTPGADAEVASTATRTATPTPIPSPTSESPVSSSPTLSPTPPPSSPTTSAAGASAELTTTPAQVAAAEEADEEASAQRELEEPAENDAPSALVPLGYIVFSLIVGGLLGWLIYILRFRRQGA